MINTIRFIYNHPLNRKRKIKSVLKYLLFQVGQTFFRRAKKHHWINGTKIFCKRGLVSANANLYCGLSEPNEMLYMLHLLRPGDMFIDVGANVGAYTILAASMGAKIISIEPSSHAYRWLKKNIALNRIVDIETINAAVGSREGEISFTKNHDAVNRVANEEDAETETVQLKTLDSIASSAALIKIDVEGYELEALKGATELLKNTKAIIIEICGSADIFGYSSEETECLLKNAGFVPYSYNPFKKLLSKGITGDNIIYIRDFDFVHKRITEAFKVNVNGLRI